MNHPNHALGWSALLVAEVTSGSLGAHIFHALGAIPPWLGGGLTALVVGVTLRVADPTLRDLGERMNGLIRRVLRLPPRTP